MKTCSLTWFKPTETMESMSWSVFYPIHAPKKLCTQSVAPSQHIVTFPHDWLVINMVNYIIDNKGTPKGAQIKD